MDDIMAFTKQPESNTMQWQRLFDTHLAAAVQLLNFVQAQLMLPIMEH
jgi:hypothetical protein